jgi:hypothetical protein
VRQQQEIGRDLLYPSMEEDTARLPSTSTVRPTTARELLSKVCVASAKSSGFHTRTVSSTLPVTRVLVAPHHSTHHTESRCACALLDAWRYIALKG